MFEGPSAFSPQGPEGPKGPPPLPSTPPHPGLRFFWLRRVSGPERTPNGPRTDPEQSPNERLEPRMDPNGSRTDLELRFGSYDYL